MSDYSIPIAGIPFSQEIADSFLANPDGGGGLHGYLGFRITAAGPGS